MFSIKALSNESRTIAVIKEKDSNKIVCPVFYTELSRDLIDIKNDFNKDVENYINITSNNIYKTKSSFCFEPVPHSKSSKTFPRFIKLIIAPSNSGKSFQIARLCERYNQAFPENNIIYASVNSLDNDVSFKEIKKSIKELDVSRTDSMIDIFDPDVKNSLVIFDDLDSNSGSLTLQSLDEKYDEEFISKLTPVEKNKLYKLLAAKENIIKQSIKESVRNIIFNGRKQHISLCFVQHTFNNGRFENEIINECSDILLFPYNSQKATLRTWLIKKLQFDKSSADYIVNKNWYQYDYCQLNTNGGKRFMLSNDELTIF